jgi:hypothetical protein
VISTVAGNDARLRHELGHCAAVSEDAKAAVASKVKDERNRRIEVFIGRSPALATWMNR